MGVNAPSTFTGNLIDLQKNGTSQFSVSNSGALSVAGNISFTSSGAATISSNSGSNNSYLNFSGNVYSTVQGPNVSIGGSSGSRNPTGNPNPTFYSAGNQLLLIGSTNANVGGAAFNPSSGNALFTTLQVEGLAISQTGSASGVTRNTYINPNITAAYDHRALEIAGYTDNFARSTTTRVQMLFNPVTYASTTASTIINAIGQFIPSAPIASTSVTISSSTALLIGGAMPTLGTATTVAGGGTVTNAYSLVVNSPVGATNNYAAVFNGNVGVGTSTPFSTLSVNAASGASAFSIGSSSSSYLLVDKFGNVGVGTSSPWRTLSVKGTVGFDGLSTGAGAGSLCLSANNEVTYSAGASCTVSSARFKHNIATSTTGLDLINQMRPVTFEYNSNIGVPGVQFGFIAEEVEKLDPRLVVHEASGTPFSVRYENLTAVLALGIQQLDQNLQTIAGNNTGSTTVQSDSFATNFFKNIFKQVGIWLADATNGITNVFANTFNAKEKICVDGQCLTKDDVAALLVLAHGGIATSTSATSTDTSIPQITIQGNNPAQVTVGTTYSDMGATVHDTNADGSVNNNLGLHFTVDGTSMSQAVLDTSTTTNSSATTTHTVVYSATDAAGNWGYATRTIEVLQP